MGTVDGERIAALRREYSGRGLTEADLAPTWWESFAVWFADAVAADLPEPNAMVVATADPDAAPSLRTVLLKGYDERGFTFFTNVGSRKGREIAANPRVALLFPWHPLQRQVIVRGSAHRLTDEEVAAYFASRPRLSRLGAWASPQSEVVADRAELERRLAEAEQRFAGSEDVPPPPGWGGFRVAPHAVELWQGRPGRLHDRLQFRLMDEGDWVVERLAP